MEVFTEEQEAECDRELSSLTERLLQVNSTQTTPHSDPFLYRGVLDDSLETLSVCASRTWQCVSHADTVSPFKEASFLNFVTKLTLHTVTMGNKTLAEWKGAVLTGPWTAPAA